MRRSAESERAAAALVALRRIVRHLRLADRAVESTCGVSVAQLFVLHQLAAAPALSLAELATRTLTDPSSVSTVVARLVDRGLIQRRRAAGDGRRAELRLAPRGARLVARAPRPPQLQMIDAIAAMPPARRDGLVRSLEALATAVGAGATAPRLFFDDEAASAAGTRRRRGARRASAGRRRRRAR